MDWVTEFWQDPEKRKKALLGLAVLAVLLLWAYRKSLKSLLPA